MVQISALNRTVDDLTNEKDGIRTALGDLEAEMARLRDCANLERGTAAHAADQLRIERDTFRGRLDEVSRHVARANASAQEVRLQADASKIQAEKSSQDSELPLLSARLQEMLDQLSSSQVENTQLRSQLLDLGNEAEKLKAQVCEVETEKSTLQDQLSQRKQEFDVSRHESSALLTRKDESIKRLEAALYRSNGELNAALEKGCDFQKRLDVSAVDIQALQAELHQLQEENERKAAANEELDDSRFDAEVALTNDRRAFEIAQNELLERTQEVEAQSRHKENLLTEALAQMAKDREEYHLTISATPEADFLLLRVVSYQASRILIRDKILSADGADELLKHLELANHDLNQYVFLIGTTRQVLAESDRTCSNIREAWRLHQVLWVLPASSFDDIRNFWAKNSPGYVMRELKRVGFFRSSDDGKLLYSHPESRRSRLQSAVQQVSGGGNESGGQKQKPSSPPKRIPARSRSRSPPREFRVREWRRDRSPIREVGETGDARSRGRNYRRYRLLSDSPGPQNAPESSSSALQLAGGTQLSRHEEGGTVDGESMQTVNRIEDIMEDE